MTQMIGHSELTKEDYYLFLMKRIDMVLFSIWVREKMRKPTKIKRDDDAMIMDITEELDTFVMDGTKVQRGFDAWVMYCKAHDYIIHINAYGDRHVILKYGYTIKTEAATVNIGSTTQQQDEQGRTGERNASVMASRNDIGLQANDGQGYFKQLGNNSHQDGRGKKGEAKPLYRDATLF